MANTLEQLRVSGITYDLIDATAIHSLDGYATTGDVTAATAAVVQTIAGYGYQTSGDVENIVSGKADTSAVTEALAAKYGAVEYDSNTKHINFYADSTTGTVLAYVDATAFVKDGMVDNVEIKTISGTSYLAITFNSDAGKQEIDIPLTDIFDASNYFTSAQTEAYVSGYTYDKQTIDNKIGQGGTFDPTQYYTKSQTSGATELSTAFSGKQDTVYVSGTTLIIS